MQTAYFVIMLIAVTWLCIWCALTEEQRKRFWWPFTMLEVAKPGEEPGAPGAAPRGGAAASWRARATEARDAQQPVSKPGPAPARDLRRKPVEASGRQR